MDLKARNILVSVSVLTISFLSAGIRSGAQEVSEETWTLGALYSRSRAFVVPARQAELGKDVYRRSWDFSNPDRGGFTFFDGVADVRCTAEGALSFRATRPAALLGWGNYAGVQPEKERIQFWPSFECRMQARQSDEGPTTLRIRFWVNGKRDGTNPREGYNEERHTEVLKGKDWQNIVFPINLRFPLRDGFDLDISGAAGNTVEIRHLRFVRQEYQGHFRKEFPVPEGRVWRAVVEVGNQARLYVNGKEVPCQDIIARRPNFDGANMYRGETLDISSYIVPGRPNCIGLYGWRTGYAPHVSILGAVVLASGEKIILDADGSWRWNPQAPEGWNRPGFDDSTWRYVSAERDKENAVVQPFWNFSLRSRNQYPIPDGCLVLENPEDTKFFYSASRKVVFSARAPAGLAEKKPVLEWTIHRYARNRLERLTGGKATEFTRQGDSILFSLEPGGLPQGVYVLETRLVSGQETLETPRRNPSWSSEKRR